MTPEELKKIREGYLLLHPEPHPLSRDSELRDWGLGWRGYLEGVKAERERQKEIWDRLSTQAGNLHTFQERLLKELFPEMK